MTREIKFRAWDVQDKRMIEDVGGNMSYYVASTDGNIKFMQFTGLKDKNGKDIYEGDIIGGYGSPSIVVIEPRLGFGTRNILGMWNGKLETWIDNNCEIIGNIYENPELLKK